MKKNNKTGKRSQKYNKIGGKPLLRNTNQLSNTAETTVNLATRIMETTLITDSSLYAYIFKIDIEPTDVYLSINATIPQDQLTRQLGLKFVFISPPGQREITYYYNTRQKSTSTALEFKNEARAQYSVFSNTYRDGANSLAPGIVFSNVYNNAYSLETLRNLLRYAHNDRASNCLQELINILQRNNVYFIRYKRTKRGY